MRTKQPTRPKDPVRTIEAMLGKIETKLLDDYKFTVGDYIRLLQFREELDNETPRDIEVTWTDVLETSNFEK